MTPLPLMLLLGTLLSGAAPVLRGRLITGSEPEMIECEADVHRHHDGSFESSFAWHYGGILAPHYGAFGEAYDLGAGEIECAAFYFTETGAPAGQALDLYVWEGGITVTPGAILQLQTGLVPPNVATWPAAGRNVFSVAKEVVGPFTIGYRADFSAQLAAYYIAADLNGDSGQPWTLVAPGAGPGTGWARPGEVWGACRSLGIEVHFTTTATPTKPSTWGRIKALFE